jgi:hypothetical protein
VRPVLGVLLVVAPTVPAGELMRRWAQGYLFSTATHQRHAPRDLVLTREKKVAGKWDLFGPDVHWPVPALLDPQRRGRQFIAARLVQLAGTRAGGFVLTRQEAAGKWGKATYTTAYDGKGKSSWDGGCTGAGAQPGNRSCA